MSQYYLNNQNLKAVNVPIQWDVDKIKEYQKCEKDAVYFIRKYCKIVNVDRGLIAFDLWPFQENMVKTFEDNRYTICKLLRQCGKTTTVCGYLLHKLIFNENYQIAILANKDMQAREILSRVKLMFEHLPDWLQQGVKRWNEGDVELENGSKALASATGGSAVRGKTFSLLYLDEFAFVPNNIQEAFFASVYPTITSGTTTKVIITSTPNGMNLFYKLWTDSENNKNKYVRCSVNWRDVPGRDEQFRKDYISNTSERQWRQEFETEFLGSSNTLIDGSKLAQITYIDPITSSGNVDVYESPIKFEDEPIKDHVYLTVVDTSRGAGIDYSAFVVFDITEIPYRVVAKYRDNEIASLLYPNVIYNVSRHFNDAYILVETNDVGQQVADILQHDLEYENILVTKVKGRAGQQINAGFGGVKLSLGVRTTTQVKRIGCANFKSLVENDKLIINDYDILYEMFRFIEHNGKYEAEQGEHDDLVMCCVLFSWLVNQDYFKEISNNDARMAVIQNNQRVIEENLAPFGFIDDGELDNPGVIEGLFNF